MKAGIRGRVLAASGVLALIVAGAFAFQLLTIRHLRSSSSLANHSSDVLVSSYVLDRVLVNLWTSPRAYIITRETSFLEPWHQALAAFPVQSEQLERLVRDNPSEEHRVRVIVQAMQVFITGYSRPLVAEIARGPFSHAAAVSTTAAGKLDVDAIQTKIGGFQRAERVLENARNARAHSSGREAVLIGGGAIAGCLLLILLFAAYLGRAIVNPVRRAVGVAGRIQGGDLGARIADPGAAELGELGHALNEMAASLQEGRDELESQNAELELQASELEDRQEQLLTANDELAAQRSELARSRDEVAGEKERIESFYSFAERLAGQTERDALARVILHALCDAAEADVGAVYLPDVGEESIRCAAVVGLDHGLVGSVLLPGGGAAGRALDERRLVAASYDRASLRIPSVGGEVAVRHELGVPILHGGVALGIAVIARAADRAFAPDEQAVIAHLAGQAAVAIAQTLSFAEARRLARINSAVLEAVNDAILLVDFDGRIILENTSKLRLVEDVVPYGSGDTIWEQGRGVAPHTTDPDGYLAELEALAADPERRSTTVYQLADGRWLQRYATPVHGPEGDLIGRLLVLREVTAEREAERLARINDAVLDAVTDGVLLVDLDGRILVENASKLRLVEELIPFGPGETIWEKKAGVAEHTTDPAAYLEALAALAADPEREATDLYQLENGRWIQRYATPVHDPSGGLIGRLFVVREVTSEREAERLARINTAVLDATRDGIMLVNSAGAAELANPAYDEILDEVLPTWRTYETVWERATAFADHMRDRDVYLRPLRAIEEDPDFRGEDEFELLSGRWIKRYTAPVYAADGHLVGRLFVLRDTTAEREAEQMKSDLVATVSHELRTPLAGVLGFAELLVTRELDAETRQQYLRTIHSEALRLTGLINDFLDLQRIEAGGFTLSIEPLDLGLLLRQAVELYSGQSEDHEVTLELADEPLRIAADEDRIVQLIGNLLSNAIKYSPTGGSVAIEACRVNGIARVTVADHGLGIPAADHHSIFTKFFRVDSSDTREIGGTGLGLALCREIVETHGGRIGFASVEGHGSTFWFELPVEAVRPIAAAPRALVVEDEHPAALLLAEHLTEAGCLVEIVATGEAALASIRRDPPALVCLDMMLAGKLDGWQVLTELKGDPATANVPVIICTGRNGRDRAAALGVSGFLSKPFSRAELLEATKHVLPGSRGSVLVVDDDASVRRLVVETLQKSGLSFREAADGEEALAAIAAEPPDAIILDLVMPKLDGFSVLERLHADPSLRLIPVIVLTGRRLSAAERRELRARTASLLEKSSYSAKELRLLIDRALAKQPLDRGEQL